MTYFLDTNVIIELLNGNSNVLAAFKNAYTFDTILKLIGLQVFQRSPMGVFIQFNSGNGAKGIARAQQDSQGAAAGTQIQYPGLPGQFCEIRQDHRIGA